MAIVKLIFSQGLIVVKSPNGNEITYTLTLQSATQNYELILYTLGDSIIIKNCTNYTLSKRYAGWVTLINYLPTSRFGLDDSLIVNDNKFKLVQGSGGYFFKLVENIATGITDLKLNTSKLTVFPNPAIDEVNVSFTANKEKTPIEVFDIQGRLVMLEETEREIGVNKVSLNISNFSAGIYIVRAGSETFKITKI